MRNKNVIIWNIHAQEGNVIIWVGYTVEGSFGISSQNDQPIGAIIYPPSADRGEYHDENLRKSFLFGDVDAILMTDKMDVWEEWALNRFFPTPPPAPE